MGTRQNNAASVAPATHGDYTTMDLSTFLIAATGSPLRVRPVATIAGDVAAAGVRNGTAHWLAGSTRAFGAVELLSRTANGIATTVTPVPALLHALKGEPDLHTTIEAALHRLTAPRPNWAGFTLDRPLIMGILNVTPDSFSDGGRFADPARAIAHGRALVAAGADIVDVGGESTRPGAAPVTPDEEFTRVEPVIQALAAAGAVISADTRHASVMTRALKAGARIINDVAALSQPGAMDVAAKTHAPVVLMHMQGDPSTMQHAPRYGLASLDIVEFLEARIAACTNAGIARDAIVVDPGIGFGKTQAHNLEILARIGLLHDLGVGILIGASRKSFLGGTVDARLAGSLAIAIHAVQQGVQIVRVHDVAETRAAIATTEALATAP
ncbi:MAG TPA: dihydropteroate synthase [Stellaceae bacterium]|nr:dihydropteroate synthase [Stellaceae bacterium]